MKNSIYLDYHSTTPVDPKVLEAMIPFFTERFGNTSSQHPWGWDTNEAVDVARAQTAKALGAKPKEIVFTGGATEATNLALFGLYDQYNTQASHIITTNTEHKSVLSVCEELEKRGAKLTVLEADSDGLVSADQVKAALRPDTLFVSIIFGNNEIGSLNPIAEIGHVCKEAGVFFHTDAVQAVGKVDVDVTNLGVDLMSITAHKFYGPKGTGALYIRSSAPKVDLKPYIIGGGHESGRRSGTLNVAGIVGLGKSIEMASAEISKENKKLNQLNSSLYDFIKKISSSLGVDFQVNGPEAGKKLPNNLSLSFHNIDAAQLHSALRLVAFSTGSACSTASATPSHVLSAIGLEGALATNTLRLSVGKYTTLGEIERFGVIFEEALKRAKISV